MNLGDLFNYDKGQERTKALNSWLNENLDYYLGPTGIPDKVRSLNSLLNPIDQLREAGGQTVVAFDPERSKDERLGAAINAGVNTLTAAAPAIGGAIAGQPARQAVMETLANVTGPLDDKATRFIADEDGAIRVWHGSPHDFDRFSMDRIGTGEGAQAYGHGLYFAENEAVARGYRDQLTDMDVSSAVRALDKAGGDVSAAIAETQRKLDNLLSLPNRGNDDFTWRNQVNIQEAKLRNLRGYKETGDWSSGRLYEVNIDANPEDFLDWDKPLSEQPRIAELLGVDPNVNTQRAARIRAQVEEDMRLDGRTVPDDVDQRNLDLAEQYELLSKTGDASSYAPRSMQMVEEMRAKGIPGIRYLDAGSRGAGDGSRNYVVFDDRLVDILSKDGVKTPEGHAQDVLGLLSNLNASLGGLTLGGLLGLQGYQDDTALREYLKQQ